MSDIRKGVVCAYCGAKFSVKYNADDIMKPEWCCFCGETFDDPTAELEDEDDDGDMDEYVDDCEEIELD